MRLIDANRLKREINDCYEQEFPTLSGAVDVFINKIIPNIIDCQPIAYDVDAVVQELEKRMVKANEEYERQRKDDGMFTDYFGGEADAYEEAIKIVRGGKQ